MNGAGAGGQASAGAAAAQGGSMAGGSGGTPAAGSGAVAGSAVGGAAIEDLPLVPLVHGHVSKFVFRPIDTTQPMTGTCEYPMTEVQSGAGLSFDGHVGMLYRTFCAIEPWLIEGEGDDLTAYELKDGKIVPRAMAHIHSPVETGEMWDSGRGDKYTWQEVAEPLVTPAGTFQHCWHRHGTETRITYCRGVGLVRANVPDDNYDLDLVEKNY